MAHADRFVKQGTSDGALRQPVEVRDLRVQECERRVLFRKALGDGGVGEAGIRDPVADRPDAVDSGLQRDPADRVGQDELADAPGVAERRLHARPTAHGLADEVGRLDLEVVEQGDGVGAESRSVELLRRAARTAEAPAVIGDATVVGRERAELVEPACGVAAGAVAEQDGGAGACLRVVEVYFVFQDGHRSSVSLR